MKKLIFMIFICATIYAQTPVTVTIDPGETTSAAIRLHSEHLVGFLAPDSCNADTLTVLTATSYGGTYSGIYNEDDAIIAQPFTEGRIYRLRPTDYYILNKYIKIQLNVEADTAETFTLFKGGYL